MFIQMSLNMPLLATILTTWHIYNNISVYFVQVQQERYDAKFAHATQILLYVFRDRFNLCLYNCMEYLWNSFGFSIFYVRILLVWLIIIGICSIFVLFWSENEIEHCTSLSKKFLTSDDHFWLFWKLTVAFEGYM